MKFGDVDVPEINPIPEIESSDEKEVFAFFGLASFNAQCAEKSLVNFVMAYKLLDEGKKLPYWHPLLIGNNDEIVKSGNSVKNRVTSETKIKIKHLPNYIFNW